MKLILIRTNKNHFFSERSSWKHPTQWHSECCYHRFCWMSTIYSQWTPTITTKTTTSLTILSKFLRSQCFSCLDASPALISEIALWFARDGRHTTAPLLQTVRHLHYSPVTSFNSFINSFILWFASRIWRRWWVADVADGIVRKATGLSSLSNFQSVSVVKTRNCDGQNGICSTLA